MPDGPASYLSAYLAERDVAVREVEPMPGGGYRVHAPTGVVEVSAPSGGGTNLIRWAMHAADEVVDAIRARARGAGPRREAGAVG